MPELDLNALNDIQGNLLRGYNMGFAKYLFYRWETPTQGREWVKGLFPFITTSAPWPEGPKPASALNVAFTYQGLNALGLSPNALASFPEEFRKGMAARAPLLGDFGENDPAKWEKFLGSTNVHALVIVHATSEAVRQQEAAKLEALMKSVEGVTLLLQEEAAGLKGLKGLKDLKDLKDHKEHKEHFGFRDGISQPLIEKADGLLGLPPSPPGGGKRTKEGKWAPLKAGEFILGYEDESNRIASLLQPIPSAIADPEPTSLLLPSPEALWKNGTFLVFRKLKQNVAKFRDSMKKAAADVFPGDPKGHERLGALMMGRWPSGCPVDLSANTDDATKGGENNFWFDQEPKGVRCPLGAHIRRTNPREGPDPHPQNPTPNDPALGSHRHRLIRRGMPYGEKLEGEADDGKERGLFFIALNASIARQFEFLQGFWVNNGEFQGLDRTDRDPIIGGNRDERDVPPKDEKGNPLKDKNGNPRVHPETPRKFTVPAGTPMPMAFNLPEFVTTRGGDYFFVPSMTALKNLAEATVAYPSFFFEYGLLEKQISDPGKLALARRNLATKWLIERAKMLFDELRAMRPVFMMPGYPALGVPTIVIATKAVDVREILEKHEIFTVRLYSLKMDSPRGPFILGMPDTRDPQKKAEQEAQYQRELAILRKAVRWDSDQLAIAEIVGRVTKEVLDKIKQAPCPTYQLDLIQDLAWRVPVRLCGEYFGVPGPDEETAKRWFRDIYTELFLNLRDNQEWTKAADVSVRQMNDYLNGRIDALLASGGAGPDTVMARLVKMQRDPDPNMHLDKEGIRRNLLGLTVGVVETTLKAIARTVDQFLRRPDELKAAGQAVNDDALFMRYVWEAMRFNPQNHVLYRLCEQPYKLGGVDIPPRSLVFAATLSAMFDVPGPEEFRIDRPKETYMFFGHDRHECLGRYISEVQIREVLKQVLSLNNLRRAKYDQYDPLNLLPQHCMLEFDA